jgi:prolyl 4-hydroxylase|tara:strand:- start:182 stop:703 length:522 start_codon:yes stop_codon:yes gene_type:complete
MNISNFIEEYKISTKLCDDIKNYYKNNKEYKEKRNDILNSFNVYFFNSSTEECIVSFFNELNKCIKQYVKKYNLNSSIKTSNSNNIQHYKPNSGFTNIHYERSCEYPKRQLVYMLYLNTINNKGGTEFPYQKITFNAIKGNLIIWPADFTHPHKGVISETEEKYIVTGWFEII